MKGDATMLKSFSAVTKQEAGVPQPVLAEIAYGMDRLPRSKRREGLQERYELIRADLLRVEWNDAVSDAFGRIKATLEKKGTRIDDLDAAIAAHAVACGATLASANLDNMVRGCWA